MKSPEQWATWIVAYMQKHPAKTLEDTLSQIAEIAKMIQNDATAKPTIQ